MSSSGQFNLYHFPEKFIVEPSVGEGSLEIDRYNASETNLRITKLSIQTNQAVKIDRINGIIGIVELVSGPYLIIIKSVRNVGTLNNAEIYRVVDSDLLPFKTDLHLSEHEKKINQNLLEMIQNVLSTDGFYYSPRDISHTLQWLSENSSPELYQQPLIDRVDNQFVWNAKLYAKFNTHELSKFVHPLIHGFVSIQHCTVNHIQFKLALISRRSTDRAGVRFHTRGADAEGNCANFVETEQIVEYDMDPIQGKATSRHITSFIQMRGSVPLFWSQKPNLKWQPDPCLKSHDEQYQCFKNHLDILFQQYGKEALNGMPRKIVILNLINHYGREHKIGTQLAEVVNKVNNSSSIKYIAFDFHRHCQSLNWERLSLLKEKVDPDIRQFGFFYTRLQRHNDVWFEASADNRNYQNGFFRTNCMDCLDRTNVVQALLAMESLRLQLQYFGIIKESVRNFDAWPGFIYIFKNLWADNGDECSKQYAGTGALKTDYTRMGKRTFGGAIRDLNNALTRYFKNNFTDGFRQDGINLFLGNYTVDKTTLPDRVDHSLVNFDSNGAAIAGTIFSLAMTLLCILVSENVSATLFWFAIFASFIGFIWMNGNDFVDQPHLLPPTSPMHMRTEKSGGEQFDGNQMMN